MQIVIIGIGNAARRDASAHKMGSDFRSLRLPTQALIIINDDSGVFTLESLQASIDFIL